MRKGSTRAPVVGWFLSEATKVTDVEVSELAPGHCYRAGAWLEQKLKKISPNLQGYHGGGILGHTSLSAMLT